MHHETLSLASMGALISPVKAPDSSQWQFWAPRATGTLSASRMVWIDRRQVNGGCTDTSAAS